MRSKIKILGMTATYMKCMESILQEAINRLVDEKDETEPVLYEATYHALVNTLENNQGKVRHDKKPNYPYSFVMDKVDALVIKVRLEMMMTNVYQAPVLDYVFDQSVQLIEKQ